MPPSAALPLEVTCAARATVRHIRLGLTLGFEVGPQLGLRLVETTILMTSSMTSPTT